MAETLTAETAGVDIWTTVGFGDERETIGVMLVAELTTSTPMLTWFNGKGTLATVPTLPFSTFLSSLLNTHCCFTDVVVETAEAKAELSK